MTSEQTLAIHRRQPSRQTGKSKSTHTSDPFLADFLRSSFDAAEYLNNALPPLQVTGHTIASKLGQRAVPLIELSSRAQTLTSQLNAHTTRLSETLTQLADEILRSGSRLAYEVELLRGETLSLTEALAEELHDDIREFVPAGLSETADAADVARSGPGNAESRAQQRKMSLAPPTPRTVASTSLTAPETPATPKKSIAPSQPPSPPQEDLGNEPPYLQELHKLTVARSRLNQVIQTFGDAMDFVFPPSEMSVSSSFLSVSAPEPGSAQQSVEEKGQEVLQSLRREVSALLADQQDPVGGIERAAQRVEQVKELTSVWRGTSEEKGRARFVESLARMVEERHRELLREMEQQQKQAGRRDGGKGTTPEETRSRKGNALAVADPAAGGESKLYSGGYGLLQRIRGGL